MLQNYCNFEKNVDYDKVRQFKYPLLREAADNFDIDCKEYNNFCKENIKYFSKTLAHIKKSL